MRSIGCTRGGVPNVLWISFRYSVHVRDVESVRHHTVLRSDNPYKTWTVSILSINISATVQLSSGSNSIMCSVTSRASYACVRIGSTTTTELFASEPGDTVTWFACRGVLMSATRGVTSSVLFGTTLFLCCSRRVCHRHIWKTKIWRSLWVYEVGFK